MMEVLVGLPRISEKADPSVTVTFSGTDAAASSCLWHAAKITAENKKSVVKNPKNMVWLNLLIII